MPLLHRKKFVRIKPPSDLSPDEDIFFCSATHEIFRNYEEFFERTILVNSLVWSCEVCGKGELTYEEAQECEARALKAVSLFSHGLKRGILALLDLTYRSSINLLVDDVCHFIKERFFVDEIVDCVTSVERKMRSGRVISVIHPSNSQPVGDSQKLPYVGSLTNGGLTDVDCSTIDLTESDDDIQIVKEESSLSQSVPVLLSDRGNTVEQGAGHVKTLKDTQLGVPPCSALQYIVKDDSLTSQTVCLPADKVMRQKGIFSKDKIRNFIKIVTYFNRDKGYYRVNRSLVRRRFGINIANSVNWNRVFGGSIPAFDKIPLGNLQQLRVVDSTHTRNQLKKSSKNKKSDQEGTKVHNMSKVKERKGKATKPAIATDKSSQSNLAGEENAKQKDKTEELQREWRRLEEEIKRREMEKQARLSERERHKEEKRLRDLLFREWSKLRDDLACDDLRILPPPTQIESLIPVGCFADALAVIEFFFSFMDVFDLRSDLRGFSSSHRGPSGCLITFHVLQKALVSKDPNSRLADMFFALLTAVHKLQQQEDLDEMATDETEVAQAENSESGPSKVYSHQLHDDAVRTATHYARSTHNRFGETLSQLHLDSMTLTEILRLHLLSSGARVSRPVALSRWRCRGGMTNLDDPGLYFAHKESFGVEIMKRLETSNVFDLSVRDKLKLLRILMDQLLTYSCARQTIDGSYDRIKILKSQIRSSMVSLQKAERNFAALKLRRKQFKKSQIEQAITTNTLPDPCVRDADEKEKENKKDFSSKMAVASVTHKPVTRKGKQESCIYLTKDPSTLDPKEITEELIQDTESALNELKTSISQKENSIMDDLVRAFSGFSGPIALGRDRAYRRYWLSRGLSGVLVESPGIDSEVERKALLAEARLCKQFETEDERFSLQNHFRTSDNNMKFITSWDNLGQISGGHPVHVQWRNLVQETCNGTEQWYFFPDMMSIDDLCDSLNQRGFRESALKAALVEYRFAIEDAIDFCPVDDLLSRFSKPSVNSGEGERNQTESSDEQEGTALVSESSQKSKAIAFGLKSRNGDVHGRTNSESASEWMELNLRESLLDLEERIYAGALGSVKVENRELWRNLIENGGYESLISKPLDENGADKFAKKENKVKDEYEVDDDSNATIAAKQEENSERVVRELSSALIQIANGIEPRFIIAPLGDHDQSTKEAQRISKIQAKLRKQQDRERIEKQKCIRQRTRSRQANDELSHASSSSDEEIEDNDLSTYEQWQQALLKATSISQIALYMSTLDRSISWSKSLLKARCKLCRRKGEDSQLLLCDGCDGGFHMYCLKPRLNKVPTGDWYCPKCRPPDPKPETPRRKRKTKSFKELNVKEQDSDVKSDNCDGEIAYGETDGDNSSSPSANDRNEESEVDSEDEDDQSTNIGEKSDCDETQGDDNENENISRSIRRSGRLRGNQKDSPTKVRLPLAIPNRSSNSNGSMSKRLSSRCRPSEKAAESLFTGMRSRLKRGHPDAEVMKDVEILVNEISKQDSVWPFLNPVRKSEVPDYYDIVKCPMDIGLMRANFNHLVYDNPQQPLVDLWRIFSNCELYNHEQSEEYQCSVRLRRFVDKRVKELGLSRYVEKAIKIVGENSIKSVSYPSKKRTRIT